MNWYSSDDSVVTVNSSGKVTAVGVGTTTIYARSNYEWLSDAICEVTVTAPVKATGVSITYQNAEVSENGLNVFVGEDITVKAVVVPEDASNKKVSWKSSNTKVMTVSENGDSAIISGISAGKAMLTVTTEDGEWKANCVINVKTVSVNGVSLSYNNAPISANGLILNVGNKITLLANVLPTNAVDKSISWNSSDKTVATVSDNGLVNAVASGNAVITVTTKDGAKTASCNVVVTNGTGNDSASSNNAGGTPSGNNTPSGNDIPGGNHDQKPTYKVSVTYDENGLVSANRTSSVSDGNVSDVVSKNSVNSYDVTVVSGNEVASSDGNIQISKADKDGNVTITLKAVSENAVVTVGFKRTTFAVSMNMADGSAFSLQVVDGRVIDPATGKEMNSLPTPEQAGLIFTGWFTADGTEVTMDNIAEIAMKGIKVFAKFDFINLVIKQKQDVTALMNISENTVVKKYVTYLVDEKGNVQKDAKGKDMAGTKYLSVTSKGIAQAKKDGIVKVVALDASKNEVASCYIRVVKPVVKSVKDIPVLSVKTASLNMVAYITNLPTNSSELVWSLANEKIAKIDAKTGKLTLNGTGSGKVKVIATFSHKDEKTGLTKGSKFTTSVTVKLPKMSKAEDKETTVKVNKAGSLKMTNLVGQKVEWKVEKPEVLEVAEQKDATTSSTLKVKGLKADSTKVTATIDGVTYTFKVVVK